MTTTTDTTDTTAVQIALEERRRHLAGDLPRLVRIAAERHSVADSADDDVAWVERQLTELDAALAGPTPSLPIPDGPKMLRETLSAAQSAIAASPYTERRPEHVARLGVLIDALDVLRPLGPNGKHGDLHTSSCGCQAVQP
ncbi:MAG: hypothetical protein J0I40_08430 [Cellulomonas sp.]|uniref:hypothetical protein n=1 Tax=Cellulomonas sp. 73-92 TaxID=1895740 RepID=UPI000AF2BC72|nr:hypothetical protein [Cellulomonas sp. 73-92]MBN9375398.1 hypothetical protein [Cellulomonas sp.]